MCGQYNLHLTVHLCVSYCFAVFSFPILSPSTPSPFPVAVPRHRSPSPFHTPLRVPSFHHDTMHDQGGVLTLTLIPTSVYNVSSIDASITDLFNTAGEYTVVWEVVGYVLIAFAIILIGVFIYCRKAVQQAIDIISEACKAVAAAPLIVFWPIITTSFILILAGKLTSAMVCVRNEWGWGEKQSSAMCVCCDKFVKTGNGMWAITFERTGGNDSVTR